MTKEYKCLCEDHEKYCKRIEIIELKRDVVCSLVGRVEELEERLAKLENEPNVIRGVKITGTDINFTI